VSERCPVCDGTDRRLISPGFYECVSQTLVGLESRLLNRPVYQTCLHRYSAGAPTSVGSARCSCGQYSVGECAVCGQARCGDHARLIEGRFQCPSHLEDKRARDHAEAVEEIRQAAEPLRRWLESFAEPEERLVAAALHLGADRGPRFAYDLNPRYIGWTAPNLLQEAFPEWDQQTVSAFFPTIRGTDDSMPPPVPSNQLAAWFRRRAEQAGVEASDTYTPTYQRKSALTARMKTVTGPRVTGWKLHSAVVPADDAVALPTSLYVRDIRHMARVLNIPPPPVQLIDAWNAAAAKARSTYSGHIFDDAVTEALRGDARMATSQAPAADEVPSPTMSVDQRIEAALAELAAQGVRPTARRVPGFYRLSSSDRLLGRLGKDEDITVESAFPVGTCTWSQPGPRGTDRYEDLPTGITPSGRIVPMTKATAGDDVEMLYRRWKRGVDNSAGLGRGIHLFPEQVANALESLLR
jgi:hypothetical protein